MFLCWIVICKLSTIYISQFSRNFPDAFFVETDAHLRMCSAFGSTLKDLSIFENFRRFKLDQPVRTRRPASQLRTSIARLKAEHQRPARDARISKSTIAPQAIACEAIEILP
jgi:hypothetical protein